MPTSHNHAPPPSVREPAGLAVSGDDLARLLEQIAHDLRSSVNVTQTWCYLLEQAGGNQALARASGALRGAIQQQVDLAVDIEALACLMAGRRAAPAAPFDMACVLAGAVAEARHAAARHGVAIEVAGAEDGEGAAGGQSGLAGTVAWPREWADALARHFVRFAAAGAGVDTTLRIRAQIRGADLVLRAEIQPGVGASHCAAWCEGVARFFQREAQQTARREREGISALVLRMLVETGRQSIACTVEAGVVVLAVTVPRQAALAAAPARSSERCPPRKAAGR